MDKPDRLKTLDELKNKYVISDDRMTINFNITGHLKDWLCKPAMTSFIPKTNADYGGTLAELSCFENIINEMGKIYITKVLYNNPATVVFWSDGTETRNVCPKDVLYNPDAGLAFCVLKKLMGGNEVAKLFNDWELKDYREDKNHWVELKDVRKAHKKGKDK